MTDIQSTSRRHAIRYLIAGAAAAVCPVPHGFGGQSARAEGLAPKLESEQNKICHQVRDGTVFEFPEPSESHDFVIIGGGPSGLCSAYRLRHSDFLMLEKEPHLGGNAKSERWNGKWYSTGTAYTADENLGELCREIGMRIHPIRSVDAAVIHGQLVPEFWTGGFWNSPYPENAKKNFARFVADMKALDTKKNAEQLDAMTFAELLKPYGPELKSWFDNFGPNNWGADAENTSALIGAQSVSWGGGVEPNRFTWPGGLGRISLALEAAIEKSGKGRIRKNATVVQVEPRGTKVRVSTFDGGGLKTVNARAVIVACPKFIGKRLVKGLPAEQRNAMNAMRYAPYLVVNVCFREVVYNDSYDTNIPAPSVVVDFVVADWVEGRNNHETKRPSVLTCYVPRPEAERVLILNDDYVLGFGEQVVTLLDTVFPGSRAKVEEVRIYRRGHPMFLAAPGVLTRLAPAIRKPFGNIFFANTDSQGGVSEFEEALKAADRACGEARRNFSSASMLSPGV